MISVDLPAPLLPTRPRTSPAPTEKSVGLCATTDPKRLPTPSARLAALYDKLCAYAHSRADASDGEMWRSNGPIYVNEAFNLVYTSQASTYATCYVLTGLGRPKFVLPKGSEFLFKTPGLLG